MIFGAAVFDVCLVLAEQGGECFLGVLDMIERCPNCRYALHGLQDHQLCPECGSEFERDCELIRPGRLAWKALATCNGVAFFVFVGIAWFAGADILIGGFLFSFGIMFAGSLWRTRYTKRYVLVSQSAIRIFSSGVQTSEVRMQDVVRARWSFTTGKVVIEGREGHELVSIGSGFLGSARKARKLVAHVNRLAGPERVEASEIKK